MYADGLAAVTAILEIARPDDIKPVTQRLFDAQAQVRLVGTPQAGRAYDEHLDAVLTYLERVQAEVDGGVRRMFRSVDRRTADAFPPELREEISRTHKAFLDVARRDLGNRRWKAAGKHHE
ncbi:hypothetical protein ACTG9Q_32815 [Actinokineospora sp. 24-640]